jgi:HK97 family phage portal protein
MTHSLVEAIKAARGRAIARAGQGRKAIEYGPPQRARANYGRAIRSLWSTDQAIERDFKQSVLVYRAVMGLASALGSVRWVAEVKAASGGGAWEADESHPLQGLLNQPHAYFARQDFNEVLAMWLALAGNALFLKTTLSGKPEPGATRPRLGELIPLSPEGIEPIPDERDWIAGYEFKQGGKHLKWKAEEILHFMVRDPSNLYWGLSPLKAAGGVIRMDVAAVGWNTHALQNRAVPGGILKTEKLLTTTQREELYDAVYDQWMGGENAGIPHVLDGDLEWQATERSPQEMDFIQTRMRNREDILSALGMPPVMAGYFENATLANAEVSRRMFWEDNLIPTYAERVAGGLNAGVVPHFGDPGKLRVGYDISGIPALREDLQKKASILRVLVSGGTPYNQAIKELEMDLPPIEGAGDVPFGLDQYRVQRQPPVEQPPEDVPSKTPTADAARPPSVEEEQDESGGKASLALARRQFKAQGELDVVAGVFTTEIADAEAGLIRRAFLAVLKALRGDVSLSALRQAVEAGDGAAVVSRLGGDRMDAQLRAGLGPRLEATALRAARRAMADLEAAAPGMALDAGRIKRWLVPYLEERVTQLAATTRAASLETVAEWAAGRLGADADALAELLRDSWGLHSQHAAGVRNLFAAMLEQGRSPGAAVEQALKLARLRIAERAEVIAGYESVRAANRGAAIPWEQAMDDGRIAGATATWFTAEDENVCEVCMPMEGQEIRMGSGESFITGLGERVTEPPVDPRCRCGLIYSAITLPA